MSTLDIFTDARTYARTGDPETSKAGARDVKLRARSQAATLLRAFAEHDDLTRYEAGTVTGLAERPGCCYWHRVSDLERWGYVAATGETRVMPTGSAQSVVAITAKGRAWIAGLGGAS